MAPHPITRNSPLRDKPAWRRALRAARAELSPTDRLAFSERITERILALAEVGAAASVFCFISHGDEVETHRLIDVLRDAGKELLVPKILPERRMIAVPFAGWDALAPGTLGIPAPTGGIEFAGTVDVCITPGLGFDLSGSRLGHGRGYYDHWFASHPVGWRIAPTFECQVVEGLPAGESDIPVDVIATEKRLVRIRHAASGR